MNTKNIYKKVSAFRELGVIIALLVLVLVFSLTSDIFLSTNNILNITRQVSVISLIAIAMTFVIITGGIDLSVGSIISFSGIITASAIKNYELPIWSAVLIGTSIGALVGFINGLLISYLRMPAFITTMGTMTILRGLGFVYTQGYPIYDLPKKFKLLGQGYIGSIPTPTIILLFVAVLASIVLNKTVFGRRVYAIGGNPEAARIAGIKVKRDTMFVYIISGIICAIAAVIQAARLGSGLPTIGEGFELDAIAAVVIGGAAMTGGSGTILGTILGSMILGVLSNGLSLLDVDSYIMTVISGCVVILAVLIDQLRGLMAKRAAVQKIKAELNTEEKLES